MADVSESHVYEVVSKLEKTTIVSIAHRDTVEKYHSRTVHLNADKDKNVGLSETRRSINTRHK